MGLHLCLYVCFQPTLTQSLTVQVVPDGSLWLGKARGLPRWEDPDYFYTAKACSWKASQATQPSSTEGLMFIGLKAYLFWIRVAVSTLLNCWPLSSLGLIRQSCGCSKHVNKYIHLYFYLQILKCTHAGFLVSWLVGLCNLQRIQNM